MPKSTLYGEVVDARGRGQLVPVDAPRALAEKGGFAPERLDDLVESLVRNVEQGADILGRYMPTLDALMGELSRMLAKLLAVRDAEDAETAADAPSIQDICLYVEKVSQAMERINKMVVNAVKAKDDATRLRSFLAGDQDRGDFDGMSEAQLRKLVLDAAGGFAPPPEEQP